MCFQENKSETSEKEEKNQARLSICPLYGIQSLLSNNSAGRLCKLSPQLLFLPFIRSPGVDYSDCLPVK